ncbi:MAG: thiamine pyrophosphate-binding protein [Casimicrobiaceae bacterium]
MAQRSKRGADVLVRTLQSAGVRRVFTLSGNHIMPVFDAALDVGIELIHTRHEASAVHMADAWARLTGEVGVALVTGGPGHANAVSALYTALMAEAPVLLLSGHAPHSQLGLGAFQEMQQAEIAKPLTKASWTTQRADSLATDIANGWRTARSGRPGPVHISLPTDVLEAAVTEALSLPQRAAFAATALSLPRADAQAIVEWLHGATRPIVLTGPVTLTRAGRARMAALEEHLAVPVVGMESPRGIADPALGAFAEVLAQADAVLLLGKKLDFTLKFGRAPALSATGDFLHVDPDEHELARSRRAFGMRLRTAIRADTFAAIDALLATKPAAKARRSGWLDDVRQAIAYRPPAWNNASGGSARLHPVQALRPLQQILDRHPDSVLVSDGGEIGQWTQACLSAPHRVINGAAGSIGSALPFALAARLAQREAPVIAVLGDGTFGFHCAEIDTAVRYGLPFIAVVGNDARWNAEYQIQLREYGPERTIGCELLPTRYDQICVAFGGHGELITTAEAVLPAAERALCSGLPACLNVMIDGLPAPSVAR